MDPNSRTKHRKSRERPVVGGTNQRTEIESLAFPAPPPLSTSSVRLFHFWMTASSKVIHISSKFELNAFTLVIVVPKMSFIFWMFATAAMFCNLKPDRCSWLYSCVNLSAKLSSILFFIRDASSYQNCWFFLKINRRGVGLIYNDAKTQKYLCTFLQKSATIFFYNFHLKLSQNASIFIAGGNE